MTTATPPTTPQPQATGSQPGALPRTSPLVRPRETYTGMRLTLAALTAFLAVTAIAGAIFVVPTMPTSYLLRGPFTDYTVPAIALGVLVGGSAVLAAALVLLRPAAGALFAILSGAMIVIFEVVEIIIIGLTVLDQPAQPFAWLQEFFIALGLVIMALGAILWRRTQRRVLRPAFSH